jgi:chromosomal replication initiation ATPase DnaA
VFQNRCKSILCEQDFYLKELLCYIHLNPLRAWIVDDIKALDQNYSLVAKGVGFPHIVSAVSELTSIPSKDLVGPCKERTIVKARALVCYWSVTELAMVMTELGIKLGIAVSTGSRAVKKGRQLVEREGLKLLDFLNM